MAQWDLNVVNEGNTPTFCATRKESQYTSIVDVTLCTSNLLHMIHGWQVDPDLVTLSDHRALKYKVMIKGDTNNVAQWNSTRVYNTSKAKWNNFTKHLTEALTHRSITQSDVTTLHQIEDAQALEDFITDYVSCITEACDKAIPAISKFINLGKSEWWTEELTES